VCVLVLRYRGGARAVRHLATTSGLTLQAGSQIRGPDKREAQTAKAVSWLDSRERRLGRGTDSGWDCVGRAWRVQCDLAGSGVFDFGDPGPRYAFESVAEMLPVLPSEDETPSVAVVDLRPGCSVRSCRDLLASTDVKRRSALAPVNSGVAIERQRAVLATSGAVVGGGFAMA
jgi:hypothetical protein